jgi:hypothetical protein
LESNGVLHLVSPPFGLRIKAWRASDFSL